MRGPDATTLLGIGRITVFGIWFVDVLLAPLGLYAELPFELFRAPGVLGLLPDGFYQTLTASPALLGLFKTVLLLGCMLLVLGVRPFRPVAIPVTLSLLLFDGLAKGFNGFVNHAQMGILFAAAILCLVPASDALSVFGRRRRGAAPGVHAGGVLAVAAFLTAAYAFIGTHRVVNGGIDIFTGDTIVAYAAAQSMQYSAYGFRFGLLPLAYPVLAPLFKLGFAATTVFEILSPLCLVSTWFRRAWLAVIIPFHVSTLLTMNIFFWENVLLVLAFVAPLGYLTTDRGLADGRADAGRLRLPVLRLFRGESRAPAQNG